MGKVFSPGKLLLMSEYVVLDGALALALPTRLGQEFFFKETEDSQSLVHWQAFHQNILWLEIKIDYKNWRILETNNRDSAEFVLKTLRNVHYLSKDKFKKNESYHINTNLEFPPDFGLGSSSTLMNNLAQWADVDAFVLNEQSLGGSGYDIAVAKEKKPILYQLVKGERMITAIDFSPKFKNELLFIHLNTKQDSREGIAQYRQKKMSEKLIQDFRELTQRVLQVESIEDFALIMQESETSLSNFLGIETVKQRLFSDCPSFVKSLGAWGGDFVLSSKFKGYESYFSDKGYRNVLGWDELIAQ